MQLDVLLTRHQRLQHELAVAYRQLPWHSSTIDELADALATVEREIAHIRGAVESSCGVSKQQF